MERLQRLSQWTSLRMRGPSWPLHNARWYVSMPDVDGPANLAHNGSGATPEEALCNVWQEVLRVSRLPSAYLRRYYCKSDEPVPGQGPILYVRWSEEKNDWEDAPSEYLLQKGITAEQVRSYVDHQWMSEL